jgi:hypothetical protein
MEAAEIYAGLKEFAPNVVCCSHAELDDGFVWDGDGPDPTEEGYYPHTVYVTVKAIANGEIVEGVAALGGSYYQHDEPLDDIHGYLPQMLQEAVAELEDKLARDHPVVHELRVVQMFLRRELERRYQEQSVTGHQPMVYKCSQCQADNAFVNQCGCDPENMPTRPGG